MKNEEILKENNGKRFSVILINPPYGMAGSSTLHLQFVDKLLDICDKQIDIMPFGFVLIHRKKQDEFKEKFSKYLVSVNEEDKKLFGDITIGSVAIYYFDKNKNKDIIKLSFLNGERKEIKSLLDINTFENNIENKIYELISSKGTQQGFTFIGLNGGENENNKSIIKKYNIIKEYFDNHNTCAILIVSNANGKMNGKYMSSKIGQIFTSYNDFYNFARDIKPQHNILAFNNKKAAENCKKALENPLLRFILYRIQDDQHILLSKCYKHIPNIDWSDDRVKTDEGLLEICGCPKNKAKDYADYCKNIIEQVDKK